MLLAPPSPEQREPAIPHDLSALLPLDEARHNAEIRTIVERWVPGGIRIELD
jgi:hypothetical protein